MIYWNKEVIYMARNDERYNDLVREYRKLARRADDRLRSLEKYAEDDEFAVATKWAYARAQRDIRKWREDGSRFNTAPPETITGLKSKISDINQFLGMKTSTRTGIVNEYKARADRYNEEMGTDFDWQSFAEYFQSGKAEKLDKTYGYATAARAIAVIQQNKEDIMNQIRENGEAHFHVTTPALDDAINGILSEYGKDITQLLK